MTNDQPSTGVLIRRILENEETRKLFPVLAEITTQLKRNNQRIHKLYDDVTRLEGLLTDARHKWKEARKVELTLLSKQAEAYITEATALTEVEE